MEHLRDEPGLGEDRPNALLTLIINRIASANESISDLQGILKSKYIEVFGQTLEAGAGLNKTEGPKGPIPIPPQSKKINELLSILEQRIVSLKEIADKIIADL